MDVDELEKLKKECEQLKLAWVKLSLPAKVLSGISLFLSASSITSLSKAIIEWKGFIKDAVDFYQQFISVPLSHLLNATLKGGYEPAEVEVITLLLIYVGVLTRAVLIEMREPLNVDVYSAEVLSNEKYGTWRLFGPKRIYIFFIRFVIVILAVFYVFYPEGNYFEQWASEHDYFSAEFVIGKIFMPFLFLAMCFFWFCSYFIDVSESTKKYIKLNVFFIILLIGVLGAINAGLSA